MRSRFTSETWSPRSLKWRAVYLEENYLYVNVCICIYVYSYVCMKLAKSLLKIRVTNVRPVGENISRLVSPDLGSYKYTPACVPKPQVAESMLTWSIEAAMFGISSIGLRSPLLVVL